MVKERRTATDLAKMIEARLEKPAIVEIQNDRQIGWRPNVITAATDIARMQLRADVIADELREMYDLV